MRCRALRRARKHLGRRGAFLMILGVGKTCWGISFIVDPPVTDGLRLLTNVGSISHWAWLWIASGLVTFGAAFLRVGRDRWGFYAALLPPTVWATAHLYAVIVGDFSRGLFVAIWYLTSHVAVIMWAATVPEYSVPPTPRRARKSEGA